MLITEELLRKGMAQGVGIKSIQARMLGLKYPLQKGWLKGLIGKEITEEKAKIFIELKDYVTKRQRKKAKKKEQRQTKIFKDRFLTIGSNYCSSKSSVGQITRIRTADRKFNRKEIIKIIKNMSYNDFLKTPYWKMISRYEKESAGMKCILCGSSDVLNVHHITYKNHGNEINYLEDLMTVCQKCHKIIHGIKG